MGDAPADDTEVAVIRITGAAPDEWMLGLVLGGSDPTRVWRAAEQALFDQIAVARHDSMFWGRVQLEVNEWLTPRALADAFVELARLLETAARPLKIATGAPIRVTFSPPRSPAAAAPRRPANLPAGTLAENQDEPGCVAILGPHVFWQSRQALHRVAIAGGPVETVVSRLPHLSSLVAARGVLIGAAGSTVLRIDPRARQVATLADWSDDEADHGAAPCAVVDGSWIFANTNVRLVRIPLAGGSYRAINDETGALDALAFNDDHLVFISGEDTICSVPIAGGASRVIATTDGVRSVASDGDAIYWTDPYECAVRKHRSPGDVVTLYQGDAEPRVIAGGAGCVAWTASDAIMHADVSGRVTVLARDLEWPARLAIADDIVVAALVPRGGGPGRIVRLPVPAA